MAQPDMDARVMESLSINPKIQKIQKSINPVNYLHNVLYYLRNLIVATPKMKMVMETHPRMV